MPSLAAIDGINKDMRALNLAIHGKSASSAADADFIDNPELLFKEL